MSWKPDHPPVAILKLHTVSSDVKDPGGETATELPFWCRVKAKHLRQATRLGLGYIDNDEDKGPTEERVIFLLSKLTGFATDQLVELDGFDYKCAANVVAGFSHLGPEDNFSTRVSGLSLAAFPVSTLANSTT